MSLAALQYTEILETHRRLHELQLQHWLQHEVFTWQWWALLGVLVIPWLIWWQLVDKNRIAIILSYGQLIILFVLGLDAAGIVGQYWIYPIKLLPVIPHEVAIDWGLLPVLHMLIYQYFRQWKTFLLAEVIAAAILAFGGEIFAEKIGVYFVLKWQHMWSVPIYTAKAIVARLIIDSLIYYKKRK